MVARIPKSHVLRIQIPERDGVEAVPKKAWSGGQVGVRIVLGRLALTHRMSISLGMAHPVTLPVLSGTHGAFLVVPGGYYPD